MKHDDKLDDIRAWIEPPSPDDEPEDGYEEWLEEELRTPFVPRQPCQERTGPQSTWTKFERL